MAWPEELHDQLGEGFPPPRAGEPESLRRDIADELSDHLACSLEREMWHTKDEVAARRAVREMAASARIADYVELVTKRELKKTAPRYF